MENEEDGDVMDHVGKKRRQKMGKKNMFQVRNEKPFFEKFKYRIKTEQKEKMLDINERKWIVKKGTKRKHRKGKEKKRSVKLNSRKKTTSKSRNKGKERLIIIPKSGGKESMTVAYLSFVPSALVVVFAAHLKTFQNWTTFYKI